MNDLFEYYSPPIFSLISSGMPIRHLLDHLKVLAHSLYIVNARFLVVMIMMTTMVVDLERAAWHR